MTREEFLSLLPSLVKDYQPSKEALEQINKIKLVIFVGPSGVGKTTLIKRLGLTYVLSDNSRTPRPGEIEGEDFYFRSDYEKVVDEIKKGQFVQVAVDSGGDLKATKASSYPSSGEVVKDIVADVVLGIRSLGFKETTTVFITPPSYEEWMRRIEDHNLSSDQFTKRMEEAKRSFIFALNDSETHFILSDNVSTALSQIESLIKEKVDVEREVKAKSIAEQLLKEIYKLYL